MTEQSKQSRDSLTVFFRHALSPPMNMRFHSIFAGAPFTLPFVRATPLTGERLVDKTMHRSGGLAATAFENVLPPSGDPWPSSFKKRVRIPTVNTKVSHD